MGTPASRTQEDGGTHMQPGPRFDTLAGGLDAEQLRLILADVNTSHRALVEELSRRVQEAENARNRLQAEVDQLRKTLRGLEVDQAVSANPKVIWAEQKEREAREQELADLKNKLCELEKQVATLTTEKTALTNEKNALLSEKANLQREQALLKAYVELLEKAISEAPYFGKPDMPKRPTPKAPPGGAAS